MNDKMKISILPEGTVKVEVEGSISDANHLAADQLLTALAERLGGEVKVTQKAPDLGQAHSHGHGKSHQH